MILADLPKTAVLVSPGVWTDAPTCQRFYLDPSDPTLLVARLWTSAELLTWQSAHDTAATARAALLAAMGARVVTLRTSAAAATALAPSETARASVVTLLPLAQVTPLAVQTELALLHTTISQIAASQGLAQVSIADLANVVSDKL